MLVKPAKPEPGPPTLVKPPKPIVAPPTVAAPQALDTGIEWVTDVSDLGSRHRFQLAAHIVEISSATRYHGGSAADIEVGKRLRVVGVYRDGVVVASTVYIEQVTPPAAERTAPARKAPSTQASPIQAKPSARVRAPSKSAQAQAVTPAAGPGAAAGATLASKPPQVHPAPKARTVPSKLAKIEPLPQPTPPSANVPAKEAAKAVSPGTAPTRDFSQVVFDERTLPMSLDHGWTLARQRDLVDGTTRCTLLSPEQPIFDGYYPAKMWFRVDSVRAWVKTDSNIDTSYAGQGLRVDGGTLVPFAAKLADEETAYTSAPMLSRMAGGRTLTVALGFWPTWPKTKTQTANIDLAGFANAYAALQACSQQQAAAANPAPRGVMHKP